MSVEVVVALISAGVAVCSAAVSAYATARSVRLQHALTLQRRSWTGGKPARTWSAGTVSRCCWPRPACRRGSATSSGTISWGGTWPAPIPASGSTPGPARCTASGDYLSWTEIVRRGLQYLDLGDDRRTRELNEILALVSRTFSGTGLYPAGAFRLFRDEQRALGEIMPEPADGELRHCQCTGYATFTARLEADPAFLRWFQRLASEADALAGPAPGQLDRLASVQHALIDVIEFLDPDGLRFPGNTSYACPAARRERDRKPRMRGTGSGRRDPSAAWIRTGDAT